MALSHREGGRASIGPAIRSAGASPRTSGPRGAGVAIRNDPRFARREAISRGRAHVSFSPRGVLRVPPSRRARLTDEGLNPLDPAAAAMSRASGSDDIPCRRSGSDDIRRCGPGRLPGRGGKDGCRVGSKEPHRAEVLDRDPVQVPETPHSCPKVFHLRESARFTYSVPPNFVTSRQDRSQDRPRRPGSRPAADRLPSPY
jgi:hypothetical protein